MTKYLNFFESESGFTEAVGAGQLFYPNVSYTEDDDTVHWNLTQPANPVETPMLRMHFITSTPGQEVRLGYCFTELVTAIEIDGTPVNYTSGGTYSVAEPGNHTAVYQFASPAIPERLFWAGSGALDTFTSAEIISPVTSIVSNAFHRCSALSSVTIPDSVRTIGFQTFYGCTSLQSVRLPDSLTDIDLGAFANCSSLYDINIPSGVTRIGEHAFLNCSGLTAIYLNPETPPSLGADALLDTNDCPIYVPAASVETYKQACPGYASRIKTMKYTVTASVNDDSLGRVEVSRTPLPEGEDAYITVYLNDSERYQVSSFTVTDGNGNNVEYSGSVHKGYNFYHFTMPASDVTVSVVIGEKEKEYNITASVNNEELGQVNLEQETASEGDTVGFSVSVFDSDRYQVSSVTVTDGNGDAVEYTDDGDEYFHHYTFEMPASDVTISVVIGEKPMYNISASVNDDSLGVVNVQETASEGEPVFVNVSVNDDCRVASLAITDAGGNELEHTDFELGRYDCYFDMPASDVTIFATLEEKPIGQYHISVDLNDGSQGEVRLFKETAQETANEGDTVRLQVNVFDPENYRVGLVSVTDGNGDEVQVTDENYDNYYTFTMPASDVTVSVVIGEKEKEYNVSASLNDDSLGHVDVRDSAPEGGQVEFDVIVFHSQRHQVTSVTVTDGNGVEIPVTDRGGNSYRFTMPASDVTVSVVIGEKQ